MSECHPLVYPPEEMVQNGANFKLHDIVRVIGDGGTYDIERYQITDVIGSGDVAQYAVRGLSTGERFSYFKADELEKVQK